MATVVRERERIQTAPNGHVQERYVDETMTRSAREQRIAWRLDHLDEWQRDLENLAHYDPRYAYDVAHEYDHDWTTDPDYGPRSIHLFEFDEDGVLHRDDDRPQAIELHMRDTVRNRVGHRVVYQTRYSFVEEIAKHLGLRTRQGRSANTVKPDLIVMPSEDDLLEAHNQDPDRQPRPDDPVPELVLEILSESTAVRDLEDKRRLYEYLGVREYLVYDLGGKRWDDSPRELLMFQWTAGIYRKVPAEPGLSEPRAQAFRSDVLDTFIRMLPDAREDAEEFRQLPAEHRPPPRFQWWDATESRWRDAETDRDNRLKAEGVTIGEARMAINALHVLLADTLASSDRDRVAAVWREHGPPMDAMDRLLAVRETPDAWRTLLLSS